MYLHAWLGCITFMVGTTFLVDEYYVYCLWYYFMDQNTAIIEQLLIESVLLHVTEKFRHAQGRDW